ncbi:uncharacterized protein N7459_002470 [Penicillium hispanicum]|uniref:uncharacterized protein n=1 Tax=Penicillium hispanicum TaxID=1080232 RepID=UPI0025412274|nr:uncharacterized protein N7459_002470 [Penicillium hispanicum]KAJ5586705.1 hypothetical protein N7459_002470 [Penicillium hispanicum]
MADLPFLQWARNLVALLLLCSVAVADVENRYRSEKYAHGFEGAFPLQHYQSADISGPILNYWHDGRGCKNGLYTIIAPRGSSVHHSGPMIFDEEGHVVWFRDYSTTYNANFYTYKGERYLAFWAGDDSVRGHGEGICYLINSHYEEAYRIHGANGLAADLHEFHITRDETAVFSVYEIIPADLREAGGPKDGWIWDGLFQEVDVETNELLFQWRASDHFSFTEVDRGREGSGDIKEDPWDWFHINSVDKDAQGNFLISSRYMECLAYIDGRTGAVIWKLGGKQSSFTDLSGGAASNISWQHHARFQGSYDTPSTRAISVFDNASRGPGAPENPSRGLFVDVDEKNMTVTLRKEYWNTFPISSQSQGSMQVLDNGNVLLGYGYNAAWTEFSAEGEVLCEVNFGPKSDFGAGSIISYRTFKGDWIGLPRTAPSAAISSTNAYVSWNGATEVATWVLQGSLSGTGNDTADTTINTAGQLGTKEDGFALIAAVPKAGFETIIPIPTDILYDKLRIVALDKNGEYLSETQMMDWVPQKLSSEIAVYKEGKDEAKADPESHIASPLMFWMGFVSAAVLVLCAWVVGRYLCCGPARIFIRRPGLGSSGQGWEAIHSGAELDELDELSDLESRDQEEGASLLKRD